MLAACSSDNVPINLDEANLESHEKHYIGVRMYTAELNALNDSGVSGMAELWLDGDQLTVTITADGLEPNMLHRQHIHGFEDNNAPSMCPPMSADTDNDGLVEIGEGLPFYGAPQLFLMPFPMAENGSIDYTESFTVEGVVLPLQNNTIVLHGMTVDGEYVGSLPVACGKIMPKRGR